MKHILAAGAFLLSGCTHTPTATETLTEGIKKDIQAIEKSLPKECQTESIKLQLTALESKVEANLATCEAEKALLEEKKRLSDTWVGFWFMGCIILLFLWGRAFFRK